MFPNFNPANKDHVTGLQSVLSDAGYDLGQYGVDGIFGAQTKEALKQFQRDHGLRDDGIVGPMTNAVLSSIEQHIPPIQPEPPQPTQRDTGLNSDNSLAGGKPIKLNPDWSEAVKTVDPRYIDINRPEVGRLDPSGTRIITYTLDSTVGNNSPLNIERNRRLIPSSDRAPVYDALKEFEAALNIKFVEVPKGRAGHVDLTICAADVETPAYGKVSYANTDNPKRHISINSSLLDSSRHDELKNTVLHEAGHVLGLSHPHENKDRGFSSGEHTVMSYNDKFSELGNLDMGVLQKIYGANPNHNSGNTMYGITGEKQSHTIADGGGFDFIFGLSSLKVEINLNNDNPRNHSTIGDSRIYLAPGASIEYAFGGNQDDVLISGQAEHFLKGGKGSDQFRVVRAGSITHVRDYCHDANAGELDRIVFDSKKIKAPIHVQATPEGAYVRTFFENGPVEVLVKFKNEKDRDTSLNQLAEQLHATHPGASVQLDSTPMPLADRRGELIQEELNRAVSPSVKQLLKNSLETPLNPDSGTGLRPMHTGKIPDETEFLTINPGKNNRDATSMRRSS